MTSPTSESSLVKARQLLREGQFPEAIAEYQRALPATASRSWSPFYLGEQLSQLDDWAGAAEAYRQAISLSPNALGYYCLGVALVRLELWDEAIEVLHRGLELEPDYAWLYLPLSQAWVQKQDLQAAMEAIGRAVALKPEVPEFNVQLGQLLRRQGRFQEAVGYLQQAVGVKDDDPQLQLSLGVALLETGADLDQAEDCLRRSLEFDSQQAEACLGLGKLSGRRGRLDEALGFYRRSWQLSRGLDCGLAVAESLGQLGRWPEAAEQYRQVMFELGESGEALFGLGQVLAAWERPREAIVEWRRAIGLGWESTQLYQGLAEAWASLERWSEAVEAWGRLLVLQPGNALVRRRRALGLMGFGRWVEAAEEWQQYWQVAPGSGEGGVLEFRSPLAGYAEIPHAEELSLTGDVTIEFWLCLRQWPQNWTNLVAKFVSDEDNEFCLRLRDGEQGQWYYGRGGGCARPLSWVPQETIRLNQWVHVAAVRKLGQSGRLYVDGVLQEEQDWEQELGVVRTEAPVRLMASSRLDECLDGRLSEVRLWSRARTGDEIRQGMCKKLDGELGLVAVWSGSDEGVVVDAVGGHHGQMMAASEAEKSRPRVGVCGSEGSPQAAGRAYTLVQLYGSFAEVELISSQFPQSEQVSQPIRGTEIPGHRIRVEDEGRFVEQVLAFVLAHPYEVVHLSKPRMPDVMLGLFSKLLWGARVIVDLDKTENHQTQERIEAARPTWPPFRNWLGEDWTSRAITLAKGFDGVRQGNEVSVGEARESLVALVVELLAVPGCGLSNEVVSLLQVLPAVESVKSELGDQGISEVMDEPGLLEMCPEVVSCPIVLFTPYYQDKHGARQDELIYCLQKNIDCPEIERIILLIDDGHEPELQSPKIEIFRLSSRATYLDWVRLTENRFSDRISVLANTDIYLDGSISRLREIFSIDANAFIALSRHDKEGSQETLHKHPYQSQDVWAVYGKYGFTESLKNSLAIPLGFPRCDNKVAYLLSVHGAKVYNPCHYIKSVHVHETQLRSYDKYGDTTVLGSVAWAYPSASLCQPSKLRISVWTLNPDDVADLRISQSLISWQKKRKGQQLLKSGKDTLPRNASTDFSFSDNNNLDLDVKGVETKSQQGDFQDIITLGKDEIASNIDQEVSDLVCGKYITYPDLTEKRQAEGGIRLSSGCQRGNSSEPLVSIITVVYNNSTTLERCINSVLNQTYRNIEYIVIDGGSNEATLGILRRYSDRIDYFVSEPDGGIYNAMNKGLELAGGDYISILNSDDWYAPDFVTLCIETALKKGSDVVYTYCKHGQNKWITPGINEGIMLGHLNISHGSFLVNRDCYNLIGKYSEDHRIISDILWIREAFLKGAKFDLVSQFLFNFSEGGLSSGSTNARKKLMISEIIKDTQAQFPFLEAKEAEDIYIFRFDKTRIDRIVTIAEKYSGENIFVRSLTRYINYCFKYRDNFKLSQIESSTIFPKFIAASEKLFVPKSSIRISTKYGCFSKLIDSIDKIYSQKKPARGKVIIHYVFNFSTASETFIYDLVCRLEKKTIFDNFVLYDNRLLEKERPYEKGLHVQWSTFREEVRNELYKYIFTRLNPDVVIAHFALNEWKLSQRIKTLGISVPTISMTHGIDAFSMRTNQEYKKYLIEDFCKRHNTFFTTVSNYLKTELESHGVPSIKISLVHNTVHERFFLCRKTDQYFNKQRTLNLLAIGRLIELKGHLYLLEGLKYFIDNCNTNVHLTIVYGKGRDFYDQTVDAIQKLNLTSHVSLIPFIDFSQKTDFFHTFDIFIQPSTYSKDSLNRSESFGMAVLEAIASGLPVIVTDAGGLPEVVGQPNKFAKIVPHGNGIAIGQALEEFFKKGECFCDNIEYAEDRLSNFSNQKQILLLAKAIFQVSQSQLNAHLFSSSTIGGAGYAAFRLHKGLLETSINPTMLTTVRNHESFANVKVIRHPIKDGRAWRILQDKSISKEGLTIFTLNHPFITATKLASMVEEADVINLHWTARFLSIENIAQLSHMGKPLVITIRDMNPLTGGCHFFHGCREWQKNCQNCPQLVDTFDDFPSRVLNFKRRYYNFDNITIVTLSRHSAEIVKQAPYFNQCRVEIIPNSIETDVFKPHSKDKARKKLGLPLNRKIIGYVPSYSSTIKGYRELQAALDVLQQQHGNSNPFVMLLGNKTPLNEKINFDNCSIGFINENSTLALAYSAADLVVVPSLEETFSNTTAEAISCGTPVVGFKTGGIPDMVKDGVTGYTFEVGDIEGLARGIYSILTSKSMFRNCRTYAEKNLSFMTQAKRYEDLFHELYINKMRTVESSKSPLDLSYSCDTTSTVMNLLVSKLLS